MRMGGDSGITGLILCIVFLIAPGIVAAQALPAPQPAPVPPVHPANDPHFSRPVQVANDAHILKVSRAQAVTVAAEQSGFGKIMSRILSKRALSVGLRGTPQAMAVGLTLDAAMSYFLLEEPVSPDAVVNQGFSNSMRNRTWGESALNKGLLQASDLTVKLEGDNKNMTMITSAEGDVRNGRFYLKLGDGSSVLTDSGGVVHFNSAPREPLFVVFPDNVEPFTFSPSPVYHFQDFSCAADIYTGNDYSVIDNHKFSVNVVDGQLSANNLTALSACAFHKNLLARPSNVISFSVVGYDDEGLSISGYPLIPRVKIDYDYYDDIYNSQSGKFEKTVRKGSYTFQNLSLTSVYRERVAPQLLPDYALSQQAEKIQAPLPVPVMNNMVNSALMHAASRADYQGIPFSTSTPVTAEEIQQAASEVAVPLTKGMLFQQVNYFPPPVSSPSAMGMTSSPFVPQQNPDIFYPPQNQPGPYAPPVSSGQHSDTVHPGIGAPSLDEPPDGKQILAPLLTLFPFIKNFTLPGHAASCPVATFDVFDRHYVMDSHCELLEKIRGLLALFAGIVWAFLALRIVLSA